MRHFADELGILQHDLLVMGNVVARSIHRSISCLLEGSENDGRQVIEDEIRVNQMQIELDDFVATLMARNQPVARDMRLLISVLKINSDLERMGDLAVNIAQRSLTLLHESVPETVHLIRKMAEVSEEMVRLSLDAFVQKNASLAFELLKNDDEVDAGSLIGRAIADAHPAVVPVKDDAKPVDRWDRAFNKLDNDAEGSWRTA